MKTDALISLLATQAGPAPRAVAARRLWPAALMGVACSAGLALWVSGWVSGRVLSLPAWWMKMGYALAVAGAAGFLAARLARPAARRALPTAALLVPALVMATLGLVQGLSAAPGEGWAQMLGHSWRTCPRNVLLLSLPALAAVFWGLRGLAPTQPRLAGAAAGLFAGGLGAAGYALSCSEVAFSFVAVWYSLGMLLVAALGAWLGPRVLRW
jgi:hypothetical protein